jgi:hypothetical protein
VDLIGPYQLNTTGWFDVKEIDSKHTYNVAAAVELAWLTHYPRPNESTYDRGTEVLAEFGTMINNDFGLICKPIATRNPQSNAVLKRIHKTIADVIRTYQFKRI